jgi:hypothetical protein
MSGALWLLRINLIESSMHERQSGVPFPGWQDLAQRVILQ